MSGERQRRLEELRRVDAEARAAREAETTALPPPPPERKRRPPFALPAQFESWIDKQIREAQERGDFDNLRGAGQPLTPDDPNVQAFAGDDALGLRLLKNNEALPAWIELNREIAIDRQACLRILDYYTAERDRDRRTRFADDYRRRVVALNEKIDQYNLIVPGMHLEQVRVRAELELRDADRRRWEAMDRREGR